MVWNSLVSTGVIDLDLGLIMDESPPIIKEAWKRSNRLTLNLMRLFMVANVKPSIPKTKMQESL